MRSPRTLDGVIQEIRLNPYLGTLAWILHRLSGLVLVVYVLTHLWVLGAAKDGPAAFDTQMTALSGGFFALMESVVVIVVAFHMFNGLRIIVLDFLRLTLWQKAFFQVVLAASVAIMAATGWVFFTRVFG